MPEIDVPFRARPASAAWSRPSSERGKSSWPCQTPLAFAVDWPWRIKSNSCGTGMAVRVLHGDVFGKLSRMLESAGSWSDVGGFARMLWRGGETPEEEGIRPDRG